MAVSMEAKAKLRIYILLLAGWTTWAIIAWFVFGWQREALFLGIFGMVWWVFWIMAHMHNRRSGLYDVNN